MNCHLTNIITTCMVAPLHCYTRVCVACNENVWKMSTDNVFVGLTCFSLADGERDWPARQL